MPGTDITFEIPGDLLPEMEVFVAVLQDAAKREAGTSPNEIKLIRPQSRPLGPGEIATVIFYLSAGVTGWLTKKWLDEYVWPEVKKRIDKLSRELVALVLAELGLDEPSN